MKKNIFMAACVALLTCLFTTGACLAAFGSDATPGSSDDPLVSKSYVDAALSYEVVHAQAGQSIIGGAGTEIVLRSGEATALDNGANGVSDMTSGTDLMSGTVVQANHLLLTPRSDGRGIYMKTEGYIMVRGEYTIK
jgi:hypothetical protein